ncbi:MAG: hypothetical protein DRG25_03455 [Deltaproteobacteria bacterium]|nr:MAG: hypothetical protein DRG25_03455 [Deltaproteobacteria bacterium]
MVVFQNPVCLRKLKSTLLEPFLLLLAQLLCLQIADEDMEVIPLLLESSPLHQVVEERLGHLLRLIDYEPEIKS